MRWPYLWKNWLCLNALLLPPQTYWHLCHTDTAYNTYTQWAVTWYGILKQGSIKTMLNRLFGGFPQDKKWKILTSSNMFAGQNEQDIETNIIYEIATQSRTQWSAFWSGLCFQKALVHVRRHKGSELAIEGDWLAWRNEGVLWGGFNIQQATYRIYCMYKLVTGS